MTELTEQGLVSGVADGEFEFVDAAAKQVPASNHCEISAAWLCGGECAPTLTTCCQGSCALGVDCDTPSDVDAAVDWLRRTSCGGRYDAADHWRPQSSRPANGPAGQRGIGFK